MESANRRGLISRLACQIAFNCDPCLECAPGAGRVEDLELTGSAGLSKDESHGPSPLS
jgi:hypothetical protein